MSKKIIVITLISVLSVTIIGAGGYYLASQLVNLFSSTQPLLFNNTEQEDELVKYFSDQNFIIKVNEEKDYPARENARFYTFTVTNVNTDCGPVNLKISFFNKQLESILLYALEGKDHSTCVPKLISGGSKETFFSKEKGAYIMVFKDHEVIKKQRDWVFKYS